MGETTALEEITKVFSHIKNKSIIKILKEEDTVSNTKVLLNK
jgi:hypothetical protein